MTTSKKSAKVTRKTKTTIQHRPLVVTMHAEFLELRRFGKRESLTATCESIYQAAAMPQAERGPSRSTGSGAAEPRTGRHSMKDTSGVKPAIGSVLLAGGRSGSTDQLRRKQPPPRPCPGSERSGRVSG
jgi:hypothetical protein